MSHADLHRRARERGAHPLVYWLTRAFLQPFFAIYFRLSRIGREHIPAQGGVILASNHRSFMDPFVIAMMMRRPVHYVAKKELFEHRWQAWILNALGAFPVDRGAGDSEMMTTARAIIERGDPVLIFPEGTRVRPGPLGSARRGVGRLALETGAPVIPIAILGTEAIRRGWRIRPHKVRVRAGRPLTFPHIEDASPALAQAVTDRIWPCVELQWEWLGGVTPLRRATIVGAGTWGTAMAVMLARAGLEVELGCRTVAQAEALSAERENARYLPGVELPELVRPCHADELAFATADLVCLAVPSRELPSVVASHGEHIPARAGMLVLSKGMVPPLGTLPAAYVSERVAARAIAVLCGPAHAGEALASGASLVVACVGPEFGKQVADVLSRAGYDVHATKDVTGAELAGAAKNAAALAAGAASHAGGPNAAGAAAGKVFGELGELARAQGGDPMTFTGLAGAGDLVATVVAQGSRNRRAGELLARGLSPPEIGVALGQAAEAVDSVPLLAAAARREHVHAPALDALCALIEGRMAPESWTEAISAPPKGRRFTRAA